MYTSFQVGEETRQVDEPDAFAALTFADHGTFNVPLAHEFEQSRAAQPFQPLFGFRHPDPIFIGRHRGRH